MRRAAVYPVTIAAECGRQARLKELLEAEKSRAAVLSSGPQWGTYGLPRGAAAGVRARWRREHQRLRAEGLLLDTGDVLVEFGVLEELRARGWDREWPAAPEDAWDQGRWPGSRDGGFPDRVSARLGGGLVERTVAACWATSCEAIAALRRWRDDNPGITPPRVRVDEAGREQLVGPLAEYERLSARVTTTGEIWRAGLARGIAHAERLARENAAGQ
ncbi:hypothetical protein PV726_48320 [Streptomyces europaeiscabiei]|uniref:hypothetical protein n=1 Tax=Streptomyces europaeiscabiei TaxID=146819 RepID=UPI0029BA4D40|nr:hypothetical protein [Streptomyces europaeiscabiei]MDX3697838.1 hypothetical protein [Streptomyces europaeiscabiei]